MALIFLNKSTCALCGKLLTEADKNMVTLPAISDVSHELYVYFDQGFHFKCYENWDKKHEAEEVVRMEKEKFHRSDYYRTMSKKYGKPGIKK